mgnify:CR=1 FL=1
MKKIVISIILFCQFPFSFSQNVSKDIAEQVATNWYFQNAPFDQKNRKIVNTIEQKYNESIVYYIFSFDKGGFIIVSANKQLEPILGYSFEGKIPEKIDNIGVRYWLDGYAYMIDSLNQLKSVNVNPKWDQILNNQFLKSSTKAVSPLLKTKWNQGYPYNLMCPEIPEELGDHTPTGCVATALAQIMKYYEYPQKGFGTYSYVHPIYGVQTADYENTFYNWDNMLDEYDETSSEVEKNAVAQLMYHCGVFTQMDYGTDGSTTSFSSIPFSLFENLNYSLPVLINHDIYTIDSLTSIIKQELDEGRPVLYAAQNPATSSGHALVCDGYDGEYFHFNFGWGGVADGYYYMDGTSPTLDFTENYYAIINIRPDDGNNVRENSVWDGNLKIEGRVGVSKDAILTIKPGTKVEFGRNGGLAVYGIIKSIGTNDNPIIFTAKDTLAGWQGIELNNALQQKSNQDSSKIVNCTIEHAKASYLSAQVLCGTFNRITSALQVTDYNELEVDSSLFRYNIGAFRGTAIFLYNSHSRISNSQFYKNNGQASILLINVRASDENISSPIIENNIFRNNTERDLGIITIEDHSRPIIDRNIFHDNSLGREGAIFSYNGSVSTITNNLIFNNKGIDNFYPQTHLFAGIECYASSSKIFNNTIVNNGMYGVSVFENCNVDLKNNIIWGNSNKSFRIGRGAKLDIQYCDIYEGEEGFSYLYLDEPGDTKVFYKNNISTEPGFISENSFELSESSKCLNNGMPNLSDLPIGNKDLGGNNRIFGGRIDIGAYENQKILAKDDIFFSPDSIEFISNISEVDTSIIDIIYINNSKITDIEEIPPPFSFNLNEDSTKISVFVYSDAVGEYFDTLKINTTTGRKFVPIKAWIGEKASGEVYGDWDSPYIKITSDIIIPDGKTLTIHPGTTIDFLGHYKVDVKGRLLAIGNSANYIKFTSQKELVGWKGIRFDNTSSSNDSSRIEYCILENEITRGENEEMNGGAVFVSNFSKLVISDCIIQNNDGDGYYGGGIYLEAADILIQRNKLINNIGGYGGAICLNYSNPKIICNYISGNWSNDGGGLLIQGNSNALISNNIIINNVGGYGGAISMNWANPLIFSNTIINNSARQDGGAIYMWFNSNPIISNNIIYQNKVTSDDHYVYSEPNKVQISMADDSNNPACYYNDLQGGSENILINGKDIYHGEYLNNIDADPLFIEGDSIYTLSNTSPCINTGKSDINLNELGTSVDFEGNYRIYGENIDIGAVEYYPIPVIDTVIQPTCNVPTGTIKIIGLPEDESWQLLIYPDGITIDGLIKDTTLYGLLPGFYSFSLKIGDYISSKTKEIQISDQPLKFEIDEEIKICANGNYEGWTESGIYHRTLLTVNGCDSIITTNLIVHELPNPDFTAANDTLTSINTYSTYQWYDQDGIIEDATSNQFIIQKSGTYYLEVSNENGCKAMSNGISMIKTGINDLTQNNQLILVVIPNPNDGKFRLRFENGNTGKYQLKIFNENGQTILNKEIQITQNIYEEEFSLSHLSKGNYFIKVFNGDKTISQKVIIK